MAHRIVGIDLGASSVKVALADPGLRHTTIADVLVRPVPPGEGSHTARAIPILGDLVRDFHLAGQTPYVVVPGDQLFLHVLEFSFRNLRRAELEKVVGSELEDILPLDLEDMVYSFEVLPREVGVELGQVGEPRLATAPPFRAVTEPGAEAPARAPTISPVLRGRVASGDVGMRALACAMPRDRASELLEMLADVGVEPRALIAAPAAYAKVAALAAPTSEASSAAIIDIGHLRSDVCIVRGGRALFARTIKRGGHHVTSALARSLKLSYQQAETAKHSSGFIGSAEAPPSAATQRFHDVARAELEPLARELRQTLSACVAKTGAAVTRAYLVGGGSRIRGLAAFLGQKLRIPVSLLDVEQERRILGPATARARADEAFLAVGAALEGATGRAALNLRQGGLAYKADLTFVRAKARAFIAAVLVVIAFATVNAFAARYKLRKAEAALSKRLAAETTALFSQPLSAEETLARTREAEVVESPMPKMTAYDILLAINSTLPDRSEVNIDVTEIDIKPQKISIKAISSPAEKNDAMTGVKLMREALEKQPCFEKVSRGNIAAGPNDTQNFPLTIEPAPDCQ